MGAAVGDHLEEAAAAVRILKVLLKVRGELVDLLGQQRNLDLRRTGILVVDGHFFNSLGLFLLRQHERIVSHPQELRKGGTCGEILPYKKPRYTQGRRI